jgi:hypothetical protein
VNPRRVAALLRELADELDGRAENDAPTSPPAPAGPAPARRTPIHRPPPAAKPDDITAARAARALKKLGYRAGSAGNGE